MTTATRSRLPVVIALSVGVHVGVGLLLLSLPASRHAIEQVIHVRLVQKPKPPKPKPPRLKPRVARANPQHPPKAAPPPPSPASDDTTGESFGVSADDTVGTMEVPVGNSLTTQATSSVPSPLVLDVSDEAGEAAIARRPVPIGGLRVSYPEIARIGGATGSAVVEAYVEADGHVSRAGLVTATAGYFGRSALEAVRNSRFKPATRGGVAVACSIRLPIRFELSGDASVDESAGTESGDDEATVSVEASASVEVATPSVMPAIATP